MYCAIDFGTSNSAVCIPDGVAGMRLVALEAGYPTMPTAVFYASRDRRPCPLGSSAARRSRPTSTASTAA
jgi:hypothetical chaperone protein